MAGEKIVDFTAPGTGGDFKLSAHKGHPVVLYFYPTDNTPGCTMGPVRDLPKSSPNWGRWCSVFRATA
jgi:peroxiredoxin